MKKILLVDDTQEIYQMVVESVGTTANVTWAKCLDEAGELLKEKEFNLLILDIELPDGDGIEFSFRIKPSHPKIPVLFITADTVAEQKLASKVGGDGFIVKPFSPPALVERIQTQEVVDDFNDVLELYLVG